MSQVEKLFGQVIYSYTREQAIDDDVLVDVTESAKKLYFKVPVAITDNLWQDCIAWDNEIETIVQDESERLYDVLWMCCIALHQNKSSQCLFGVLRVSRGANEPTIVKLKSVVSGGDEGEPVITIMMPWED